MSGREFDMVRGSVHHAASIETTLPGSAPLDAGTVWIVAAIFDGENVVLVTNPVELISVEE